MKFLRILEAIVGRQSRKPEISAVTDGRVPRGELRRLAKLTRLIFRQDPELGPPGPKLQILMTSDVDPATGRAFKDYKARRLRRREEAEASHREVHFAVVDHDVSPD